MVERELYGIPFGSDAYSYLVWARDAVQHGTTHHSSFDYTVPKPLELGVAALGQVVGAPLAVFGGFTVLGQLGAVVAVAWLGFHLAGRRAAIAGAVLALALPVLWRGGPAGDSNVPYAALVVGGRRVPAREPTRAPPCSGSPGSCGPRHGASRRSRRCSAGGMPSRSSASPRSPR